MRFLRFYQSIHVKPPGSFTVSELLFVLTSVLLQHKPSAAQEDFEKNGQLPTHNWQPKTSTSDGPYITPFSKFTSFQILPLSHPAVSLFLLWRTLKTRRADAAESRCFPKSIRGGDSK